MRNWEEELNLRVNFIKELVKSSNAKGIVFGNSGGKDCALVGILCKKACENTLSVMLPCGSNQNYGSDLEDAKLLAKKFDIKNVLVDIKEVQNALINSVSGVTQLSKGAIINISPRLRMATLYSIAHTENRLVAGTGNRSERYMGYFTKWGDGAFDFNPISDLTVTEVYQFLKFLGAPESIIKKAPSAGLYEGQTDEKDMGVSYAEIDRYLMGEEVAETAKKVIERYHASSTHKTKEVPHYKKID